MRVRRHAFPGAAGFTLLEVLVVVAIVGVVLTTAVIGARVDRRDQRMHDEIERLYRLVQLAAREAVMEHREFGVYVDQDRYRFVSLAARQWQPLADPIYRERRLPEGLSLHLNVEDRRLPPRGSGGGGDDAGAAPPQIVILSSGEMVPFQVLLEAQGSGRYYRLEGAPDSTLRIVAGGDS